MLDHRRPRRQGPHQGHRDQRRRGRRRPTRRDRHGHHRRAGPERGPVASGTLKTRPDVVTTSGAWTPAGATYAYQWQRDSGSGFADISGATAATYTLTNNDAGAKVRSKVTATNTDGSTAGYSKEIGPVLATPANTRRPGRHGHADRRLDAHRRRTGTWASAGNLTPHLQVPVGPLPGGRGDAAATGCVAIAGATNATYTTVAADVGAKLAVRVTATNTQSVATDGRLRRHRRARPAAR